MAKYDYENIIGVRFNKLVVVAFSHKVKNARHYLCKCKCGNECTINCYCLFRGSTQSCGCFQKEQAAKASSLTGEMHGATFFGGRIRIYRIWAGMKDRCYNPNKKNYHRYGGRGITVCEEWRNSFEAFRDWALANGYADDLAIDRFPNNDGNYEPANCRWATTLQNNRNRPSTLLTIEKAQEIRTLRGKMTYLQLANKYGVSESAIWGVLSNRKWKH